jgi:hypothetical protein
MADDTLATLRAIVRDVAEAEPLRARVIRDEPVVYTCLLCRETTLDLVRLHRGATHDPTCPWARARAWLDAQERGR